MKNYDIELRDVTIQGSVQRLINYVNDPEDRHTGFSPSIYMVPSVLRDLSPGSFSPKVVSIGPLHREDENVQAFEMQKASYMKSLMGRINTKEEEILKSCMQEAYDTLNDIKACYVLPKTYSDIEIAEMMVIDACFILEFSAQVYRKDYDKPHTKHVLVRQNIRYDMLLLENQIPFFFLDKIHQRTLLKLYPEVSLIELMRLVVLGSYNLFKKDISTNNISINNTHHILSLLHQCYKPHDLNIPKFHYETRIHSAVDLDRAGVNFEPNKDTTWVMAMAVKSHTFPYIFGSLTKRTLTMPTLIVHDFTELVLRNLIAYEQSFQTCKHITSYCATLDMLVNNQEDVAKLVDSGVISNFLGSYEEAANMINNICKNVFHVDVLYEEQCIALDEYCNSYLPKHIAKMRSTYFSSPWSIIALFAGIILFALTVVQTIFSIKSTRSKD
ncbi:hypothetical protein L1987_82616 [Smallanthus sonchifolius]|uniref:Uncharacterized protein n=1 Tax=Smallanthus sonchifolius TaxID=185202 RepID=A0ACB8YA70_9ASTR|nr:hypothetical protein L1987_82616 [Smallanthus sonchifolius]